MHWQVNDSDQCSAVNNVEAVFVDRFNMDSNNDSYF